jgi:Cellulase (glycosyl hydrolase family 5)
MNQPPAKQTIWQVVLLSIATVAAAISILAVMVPSRKSLVNVQFGIPRTPTATPVPLPGLSVKGTRIVDSKGHTVTLVGVTRSSLEYDCNGDGHYQPEDFQAIRLWGANVVRITISSAFWVDPHQRCQMYHQTVAAAVSNAQAAGLYVVLTLQWSAPVDLAGDKPRGGGQCPLPNNGQDLTMWHDLATMYQNNTSILFELLSEPHTASQYTWYHGGKITSDCYNTYNPPITYTGMGMLDFTRQVRAYAPQTILIISGNGYGYDLSGVGTIYPFPLKNILYGTHPFDHPTVQGPSDWGRAFGLTAHSLPVIATEFGAYDCKTGYISQAIAYFTKLHMSWLAWGWEPLTCASPALIKDWKGTPMTGYGDYIRQQMLIASKQD